MKQTESSGASTQSVAFSTLLETCLGITSTDELLIVFDESLTPFFPALTRAIDKADVSATFIFIPKSYQLRLLERSIAEGRLDNVELPTCIVAAISASTAMVNLLDSDPETSAVRKAVNHRPRPRNCRLATIPGISEDILASIACSPFEDILKDCERVAWILGESHDAEIESYDSNHNPYTLRLQLNGWDSEPVMSPGLLLPGSWGNVPPGETFCCPRPETVSGTFCINGSVPHYLVGPGEEVFLTFDHGHLIEWSSAKSSPALTFFDTESRRAAANSDRNWHTFAELGIGMNPKVTSLTGNPLFDEKALNTLHIAIGDNSNFGDDVVSLVHHDLITVNPTLRLDQRVILDHGVFQRDLVDSLRKQMRPVPHELPRDVVVTLRESKLGVHKDIIQRRLSKAYRINFVQMADIETSALLSEVCDALKAYKSVHLATFLKSYPMIGATPTENLLAILYHYRALRLTPPMTVTGSRVRE